MSQPTDKALRLLLALPGDTRSRLLGEAHGPGWNVWTTYSFDRRHIVASLAETPNGVSWLPTNPITILNLAHQMLVERFGAGENAITYYHRAISAACGGPVYSFVWTHEKVLKVLAEVSRGLSEEQDAP